MNARITPITASLVGCLKDAPSDEGEKPHQQRYLSIIGNCSALRLLLAWGITPSISCGANRRQLHAVVRPSVSFVIIRHQVQTAIVGYVSRARFPLIATPLKAILRRDSLRSTSVE
jgi:hypothetical protein